jgi:branched-chain amino acid transport system ATP-binding protein
MTDALLSVRGLHSGYGDFEALHGLDLTVPPGTAVAIIGANGAGKTTLLRTIAGLVTPTEGYITFEGQDLAAVPPYKRPHLGIAMVPEGRRLFTNMTVEENLLVGGQVRRKGPWNLDAIYDLFPLVAERRKRITANLSGGEQQAVAIGRALMTNPRLLLLDEVSLGLAPVIVGELYAAIPRVAAADCTLLIVEQDVRQALKVATYVQCLLEGRTSLAGAVGDVSYEAISAAYFGVADQNPTPTRTRSAT